MRSVWRLAGRAALLASAGGAAGVAGYVGLVTAAVPIDLGVGRRRRPLGPLSVRIAADRDTVFDVLAAPYLGRQTRALAEKIQILERGSDMVLAAHRTPVHRRLTAITVETVRFTRPERIDFFLVRGPVPEVVERFTLTPEGADTVLAYDGHLGTDLWGDRTALGRRRRRPLGAIRREHVHRRQGRSRAPYRPPRSPGTPAGIGLVGCGAGSTRR